MNSILPPPPTAQTENRKVNELSELAAFIKTHSRGDFDRHLSILLDETSQQHDIWSRNCDVSHWYEELPCEEFERGVSLGIAWLKARIKDGGAADGS